MSERNYCHWWERHLWSKWTYVTVYGYRMILSEGRQYWAEEWRERQCSRCGKKQKRFVKRVYITKDAYKKENEVT